MLPELRGSVDGNAAAAEFYRRNRRHVLPDGGHAERSPHYHRYALDFYLLALSYPARHTMKRSRSSRRLRRGSPRPVEIADMRGRLPLIGDDDGGCCCQFADASPSTSAIRCGWRRRSSIGPSWPLAIRRKKRLDVGTGSGPSALRRHRFSGSRCFPDTGYVVLRSADTHAVLDVGRHGYLNGGHAHADALSVVLSTGGHPPIVDPGTATYTMDLEYRGIGFARPRCTTASWSTADPGSVPAGPFHWKTRTDAEVIFWWRQERATRPSPPRRSITSKRSTSRPAPLVHRRAVLRADDDLWLIVDYVLGTGRHRIEAYFHLDPAWTAEGSRLVTLTHRSGSRASMASASAATRLVIGDPRGVGWYAPIYGQVVPAPTICFNEERECPWSLVTAVGPSASRLMLSLVPVSVDADDGWHRVAVLGKIDGRLFVALFATPVAAASSSPRRLQRIQVPDGELVTDARVALARTETCAGPGGLALLEARSGSWTGRCRTMFGPATAAANLHLPFCIAGSSATVAARA